MNTTVGSVVAWAIVIAGCLFWGTVLMFVVALPFGGSHCISFGCARCDWSVPRPRRIPPWILQIRYRSHCVRQHHDWPPIYTRDEA